VGDYVGFELLIRWNWHEPRSAKSLLGLNLAISEARIGLLSDSACESARPAVCRSLGHPFSAEETLRALGRRNWIHIGSKEAGPRVAAIVSIVETSRRLKIPIRDYLCSILPGLANFPINRISELTPAAWLAKN